jgi:2-phospho-L-lactate/phosphoenolpyruvate guanylyltransferase
MVALQGANSVLVLPADVPLVSPVDIEHLIYLGRYPLSAVVVPDRHEDSSNALLLTPPGHIRPLFGPGSFQRNIRLAQQAGMRVMVHRSEHLGLDIDCPEDAELCHRLLYGHGWAGHAQSQ